MITELTVEQELKLAEYRNNWTKVGLSTHRIDLKKAKDIMDRFYTQILKKAPVEVVIYDSPYQAWEAVQKHTGTTEGFTMPYTTGANGAGNIGYYAFMEDVLGVTGYPEGFQILKDMTYLDLSFTLDDICILSQRPTEIHTNNGMLHNDKGAAVKYADGVEIYILNGVKVPSWVVTTDADKIPMSKVLQNEFEGFDNTHEIRSELMKIIGAARLQKELKSKTTLLDECTGEELYSKHPIGDYYQQGDVLFFKESETGSPKISPTGKTFKDMDKKTQIRLRNGVFYKLLQFNMPGFDAKALYMGNPSVDGEEHIEFVDDECHTVFDAIIFRNYTDKFEDSFTSYVDNNQAFLPQQLS